MVDEKLLKQLKDLEKLTGGRSSSELYDLKMARDLKNKTLGYEKNDLVKKYNLPIGLDKEILNFINHNKEISNFIKINTALLNPVENMELLFIKKVIDQNDLNFFKQFNEIIKNNRGLTDEALDAIDEYLERKYPESLLSKFIDFKNFKFSNFQLKLNISINKDKFIKILKKIEIISVPAIATLKTIGIIKIPEELVIIATVSKYIYEAYEKLKKK